MPALEMAQETGKLVSWLKREGESVTKGEPLLEIETDQAVMEDLVSGRLDCWKQKEARNAHTAAGAAFIQPTPALGTS